MKTASSFAKRFASEHFERKEENSLWWASYIGFIYGFKKCKKLYHYNKKVVRYSKRK